MSNEQSIRDELAAVIDKEAATYEPVTGFGGTHEPLSLAEGSDMAERIADKVLASPVIRRIQAEALREAAQWFKWEADGKTVAHHYPYAHGERYLRAEADRIERGEAA